MSWRKITMEDLPKCGDEVVRKHGGQVLMAYISRNDWTYFDYARVGWRYFRSANLDDLNWGAL